MIRRIFAVALLACFCVGANGANPSGKWKGSWHSASTGHQGPLRANIRQVDANHYRAVFSGRFAKVIPFIYRADLTRVPGTCDCYTSTKRMLLLGEYKMNASVTSNRFHAKFGSGKDAGIFTMSK